MESSLLNYNFTPVIIPNQDDSFKTLEKTKVPRKFRFSPEKKVLTYQIEWLKSFGFNDIYIVFDITIENDVHSCIEGYTDSVKLISEDYLSGNVDALKIVKNMISTDLIVLAGEILLDVDLYQVIDQYKICDGILTMVLEEVNVEFKQRLKTNEVPVYALSNEKELLFTDHFYNEQGIHISKPLLSKYNSYCIRTDLHDPSIYIFSKYIMKNFIDDSEMKTISDDLVPKILREQHYTNDEQIKKKFDEKKQELFFAQKSVMCNAFIVKKN